MNSKAFLRAAAAVTRSFRVGSSGTRLKYLSVLLLLAALISLGLYLRFSFEIYPTLNFQSDDAAALLFSNEVLKQHSLFPAWYNSTGILVPFLSPELSLLPILLAVSDHWMACFRTAVAVDQLLMAALVWWILGQAGLSRAMRLFLLCFLFASVSSQMAQQTVMIAGQDWFYAKVLLLSFLVFRCLHSPQDDADKSDRRWLILVLVVGALLFIDKSNISQMLPPLVAAFLMLWMAWADKRSSKSILAAFAALVLAAAIGQFAFRYLRPHAVVYHHIAPTFVDLNAAGANLLLFLRGLMELFGAAPPVGENIYSITSVLWATKLAILCIVFIGPLWLLTRWRKIENDFLRLLIIVFTVSLALRMLVYLFTGISVGVTATNRYFISDALMGLTIMLLYSETHWQALPVRAGALVVATVLVAGSPLLVARPTEGSEYHRLARFLEGEQLHQGYATFWNAGVLTALADNRIQVRQIILGSGEIRPYRWLSSSRWYEGDTDIRESFLLLKGAEGAFNMAPLTPVLGKPVRIVNFGDYRALVFPFDLAQKLGWKYSIDEKLPPADRRVAINSVAAPVWSARDRCWTVTVRVTNRGKLPIGSSGSWPVNLGIHLLEPSGKLLDNDYARATLPMIEPGESVTLPVTISDRASGQIVEFDPVQENVAWFHQTGSPVLQVHIPRTPTMKAAHDSDVKLKKY